MSEISLPEEFKDGGTLDLSDFVAEGWYWGPHLHFFEGHKPEGYECPGCKEEH